MVCVPVDGPLGHAPQSQVHHLLGNELSLRDSHLIVSSVGVRGASDRCAPNHLKDVSHTILYKKNSKTSEIGKTTKLDNISRYLSAESHLKVLELVLPVSGS